MRIIFCDSVLDNKVIEPDYEGEKESAVNAGFSFSLISFEELTDGNIATALRFVRQSENKEFGIYRGWMLTPSQYQSLYDGLLTKNIQLVNSPSEYKHCHYLPDSYSVIESQTAKSTWINLKGEVDFKAVFEAIKQFGDRPIIVKDFVKSEKHNWEDACYIPKASDYAAVRRIVLKFIELRGAYLNEGLVFREFLALEELAIHSISGMPLTLEFRFIFLNNKPIAALEYWDEGDYGTALPDVEHFTEIARQVNSQFFTMDVAKTVSGKWIIIELGDGQVAGLPNNVDMGRYYQELKTTLQEVHMND